MDQVKDLLELVCDSSMEKLSMELARASSWIWNFYFRDFPSAFEVFEVRRKLTESRQIVFGSQRYTVKYP